LNNDATVGDFLNHLGIKRRVIVAVNDQPRIDATYVLQDGDRVVIYTLVGGG
jgi:thiamine biosynthesis protein ThiS